MNYYLILLKSGRGHFIKSSNEEAVKKELIDGSYYLETHTALKSALDYSELDKIILVGEYKKFDTIFNDKLEKVCEEYKLHNNLLIP